MAIKTIRVSMDTEKFKGDVDVPVCYGKAETRIRHRVNFDDSKAVQAVYSESLDCSACDFRESCRDHTAHDLTEASISIEAESKRLLGLLVVKQDRTNILLEELIKGIGGLKGA